MKMDFQELIDKYTKIVAKRLYDLDDVKVIFDDNLSTHGEPIRALCKLKEENTVYYHGIIFKKYPTEIPAGTYDTIVHEITHYEIGMEHTKNLYTYHSKAFRELLKVNLKKVKDLRKQFNRELSIIKRMS
jgi:hypothetical protein